MSAENRFFKVRLDAAKRWPYCAHAILSLVPVSTSRVPRMAIDKHWRVYYNPEWVTNTGEHHLVAVILHEFSHALRQHFRRFIRAAGYDPSQLTSITAEQKRQAYLWNVAGDCEINDDLEGEGLAISTIPDGGAILPSTHGFPDGQTAEWYFRELSDSDAQSDGPGEASEPPQCDTNAGESPSAVPNTSGDGEGAQPGDTDRNRSDGDAGDSEAAGDQAEAAGDQAGDAGDQAGDAGDQAGDAGDQAGDEELAGQGAGDVGADAADSGRSGDGDRPGSDSAVGSVHHGDDGEGSVDELGGGSVADGFQRSWEDPAPNEDDCDDVAPGLSESEQDHLVRDAAEKIEQHHAARGNVPAGLRRWATGHLRPQVPWQKLFRRLLTNAGERAAGCRDHTFAKVSRREPARSDLLASSPIDRKIRARIIVDTSGSMGTDDLDQALSEINAILRTSNFRDSTEVGSCDSAVHSCERVFKASKVKLVGGGGTDMSVPLNALRTERAATRPHVLIIITDGITPWPARPVVGVTCIVVLTRQPHRAPPNWLRTVNAFTVD